MHKSVLRSAFTRLLASAALLPVAALAQQNAPNSPSDNILRQQRVVDERRGEERRKADPLGDFLDWQWGGWVDFYSFHFQDGDQSQRLLQRPSASLWTRITADDGAHEIFARTKLTFEYYAHGDEFDRQQDWIGPNLDRGWYEVDIGRALHISRKDDPLGLSVRLGRQDVQFGTGYALDLPLDAVRFDARLAALRVTGIWGRTIGSYPNVDRSEPVDSHSARRIGGVQLTYEGIENHRPFAYAVWNDDFTDERPQDPRQNYAYDTRYFGFGSRGSIITDLNYWAEAVFEFGKSYGDGDFYSRDDVRAFGSDIGIEKLFRCAMRPRLAAEYMFASGDNDRIFSPTNAAGGNYGDRIDRSFVGFGFRDTGISSGLTPSNLHIWKVGGSLHPLEQVELLRDFEVGTNWFLYHKNRSRAAISDTSAGEFDGFVGWEMDYFVNWRLSSDLAWTIRWGMFFPGDAFDDRGSRSFLLTGLTWSF